MSFRILRGRPTLIQSYIHKMSTEKQAVSVFASVREERQWNKISEKMNGFHEYFKHEFNTLYELADGSFERRGLSLPSYLDSAKSLNDHLTMHHRIEERFVFPILAKKMPQFGKEHDADGAHIASHHGIHEGLAKLEKLVEGWSDAPSSYSPKEMKECLDGFRDVLFRHLDEEVTDLRGENLKKYLTLQEMQSLPL